jgi:hypothetical protein
MGFCGEGNWGDGLDREKNILWVLGPVNARRLSVIEVKLVCYFKLVADMFRMHLGVCGLHKES